MCIAKTLYSYLELFIKYIPIYERVVYESVDY